VEHLPDDSTLILGSLIWAHHKLDDILAILTDDEEEADDETDT
jgi:hypothetical protein